MSPPRDRAHDAPRPDAPTHAGGVVWRRLTTGLQFLLVRPAGPAPERDEWVLPKGHIERGEGPEEAALREVLEEAGAVADLGPRAGLITYTAKGARVSCVFYAMELRGQREPEERREVRWATLEEVRALMPFPETVALVERVAESLG